VGGGRRYPGEAEEARPEVSGRRRGVRQGRTPHDFARFDAALIAEVGPEEIDGPYLLELHPHARVVDLRPSRAAELIPRIGRLAQTCGLAAAELQARPPS
jgi:hypothetical protein